MILKVFVSISVGGIPHGTTLTDRKANSAQENPKYPGWQHDSSAREGNARPNCWRVKNWQYQTGALRTEVNILMNAEKVDDYFGNLLRVKVNN